jgi:hypothetical protein
VGFGSGMVIDLVVSVEILFYLAFQDLLAVNRK